MSSETLTIISLFGKSKRTSVIRSQSTLERWVKTQACYDIHVILPFLGRGFSVANNVGGDWTRNLDPHSQITTQNYSFAFCYCIIVTA